MKKYLLGCIGLAFLGVNPLLGQTPRALPHGPAGVPADVAVQVPCPDGVACTPTKTICVPECYVKKTTKPVYRCGCEPLCVPYYHFRDLLGHCGCDTNRCEPPFTRRYLIKKVKTCEENATKCVPMTVPACENDHRCP
jgi:hypothetical protein